jgi:hypothetical protein
MLLDIIFNLLDRQFPINLSMYYTDLIVKQGQ